MWSTDKEKFFLTKRENRQSSFVCGFKSKDIDIVIVKIGEKEKLNYYDHNYKATISWGIGTSEHNFKANCFGNNFIELTKAISRKIDVVFGDHSFCMKRPENIDQSLLKILIDKDIIMAFDK
jgi:hypothetical protein